MDFKKINLSEDTISMILGLAIVVLVVGLIFNFFQKQRGSVSVPGVTETQLEEKDNKNIVVNEKQSNSEQNNKTDNTYTVKKGDSLWKIAQTTYGDGNHWVEIAKENGLKNPGVIHSGLVLKMPSVEKKESLAQNKTIEPKDSEYTVVKGDNLWKISVAQYGDGYAWPQVYRANNTIMKNPNFLMVGTRLRLPKISGSL